MKKIMIVLGIATFFSLTAFAISFGTWTWINFSDFERNQKHCEERHGSMVTQERRTINDILQVRVMCICNPGYYYDPSVDNCLRQE